MAVEAQLYPERLGLFLPMCGFQDWTTLPNNPPTISIGFPPPDLISFQQQPLQASINLLPQPPPSSSSSSSSSSTCDTTFLSMSLSQSLNAHLQLQRQEFDCILQLQNDRLRAALQHQRDQQLVILLKGMESKALSLIRQKENDLVQATNKSLELEIYLSKAQMENESWQRLAREKEAMVLDLRNTLEQVRERLVLANNNKGQDAESVCCGGSGSSSPSWDDKAAAGEEQKQNKKMKKHPSSSGSCCKRCNSRRSCVLFLPCRHLCSCKSCESFLASCPVCNSAKEASMEVFWV